MKRPFYVLLVIVTFITFVFNHDFTLCTKILPDLENVEVDAMSGWNDVDQLIPDSPTIQNIIADAEVSLEEIRRRSTSTEVHNPSREIVENISEAITSYATTGINQTNILLHPLVEMGEDLSNAIAVAPESVLTGSQTALHESTRIVVETSADLAVRNSLHIRNCCCNPMLINCDTSAFGNILFTGASFAGLRTINSQVEMAKRRSKSLFVKLGLSCSQVFAWSCCSTAAVENCASFLGCSSRESVNAEMLEARLQKKL